MILTDAHLAALTVEHNCVLPSNDLDFARFRGLKWNQPIATGQSTVIYFSLRRC